MHWFRAYLIALAATLAAGAASAHAFLSHTVPLVGSTIPSAPPQMTLDFTQGVETQFSSVVVKNAQGARVDRNNLHVAPSNTKRLIIGLEALKPGTYSVSWRVKSVDTHTTEGTFTFTVQP